MVYLETYGGTSTDAYTRMSPTDEWHQVEYVEVPPRDKPKTIKKSYRKFTPKAYKKGWGRR